MNNIIIRKADINDQKRLFDYHAHYKNKEYVKSRIKCYTTHNSTIIALEKDKIVGMLQWHIKENPDSGVAEFEEVFVDEESRNKGIATGIVEFAIEDVKKKFHSLKIRPRSIFLFTSQKNIAARKLYEKFGFIQIADLNDLFSEGIIETFYCYKF